jgi:hypothetical protein
MILERTPKKTRQSKSIIVNTVLRLPQKNRKNSALLNIGAENNFISQRLTIKINLFPKRIDRSKITIDKYKIYIYNNHRLPTITIDSHKKTKKFELIVLSDEFKIL